MASLDAIKDLVKPYVPKGIREYVRRKRRVHELELLFQESPDPWKFASSSVESERFAAELELLSDRRYASAVEVGCAEGMFTERLAQLCDKVVALDCSKTAVLRARARLTHVPHVSVLHKNVGRWRPPQSYDLVTANEVLYYVEDQSSPREFRRFLGAVANLVKPGGRLLMSNVLEIESPDGAVRNWESRRNYVNWLAECGLAIVRQFELFHDGEDGRHRRLVVLYERPALTEGRQ